MSGGPFIDWLTASQFHPGGSLPLVTGGVIVHYDPSGFPLHERNCASRHGGSYGTGVRVSCDGYRVGVSGNVGRLSRPDNVFNHHWSGTLARANRVLADNGLPAFDAGDGVHLERAASAAVGDGEPIRAGCRLSRLDLTANYAAGSDSQARAVIRWLTGRSVSRMRKGYSGDSSVWFSNTRHMLKAYLKGPELVAHGMDAKNPLVAWCMDKGIVRVEVELKKRLLSELKLNEIENVSDEVLAELFREQTAIFRGVDRSDEPDIIDALPVRSRAYASAWLAGQDVRNLCSRRTLFRHAKALREFGIDILEPRSVERFPVRVRVIDLEPVEVPDWYDWGEEDAA